MKMNIKKQIFFGLAVLSLLIVILNVFGATSTTSGTTMISFYVINITMVNQEPSPAEAGRYVTVRFKIDNKGRENAEDVILELLNKYPFSLDPGDSAVKYIGSMYSTQIGKIGVIVDYKLKVDENAIEGDNKIELRYKLKNNEWTKVQPFYINIKPHDILLSIESIDAPNMIKPGETSEVKINLKNLALSLIKDVKVRLKLDSVPLATIGSTNRQIIEQMEGGSNTSVIFNLMAEPDAKSKLYKVPIEIEFLDRLGNIYTKNETVGLAIGAEPDLNVLLDSSQIYSSGGMGDIVIKFVNKGVTDVKFLNVILGEGQYEVLSPAEVYVGNIDSDDYETADFKLALKRIKGKEVVLPLTVKYKDANNNDYSKKVDLKLRLYSASEAKALGLKKGSNSTGIIIVLIIVIGGFFFYRKWKKKNDGKKFIEQIKLKIPFFKKK